MHGFSSRNLKYMRTFAESYPDEKFVQQVVAQIPWGHSVRILDYVKDPIRREWYISQTITRAGVAIKSEKMSGQTTQLRGINTQYESIG
jgi:predicted nuclease of restriction endonuclease-like (RecB) superfamily